MLTRAPYVAARPASGALSVLAGDDRGVIELGPRRWGRPAVGDEQVAVTSCVVRVSLRPGRGWGHSS